MRNGYEVWQWFTGVPLPLVYSYFIKKHIFMQQASFFLWWTRLEEGFEVQGLISTKGRL